MTMTAKRRAVAGCAVLLVLFLALVFLQIVVGDRLQREHASRAGRLESARDANRSVLQDMTDAETGVRGFQLTGEKRFLDPYDSGRVGAFTALEQVDATADDPGLRQLLTVERQAAVHWLYAYAIPIVNSGVADADERRADRGKEMFDLIRTANADADAAIAARQAAGDAADLRAERLAQLLFALLAVAILVIGLALAILHQRHLLAPVEHVRQTLGRLAAGDLAARAVPAGPGEMRTLIGALNDLAADTERMHGGQARLISELRILDEQKDVFVSTVTHELRTPLTSILGYTEMLADALRNLLENAIKFTPVGGSVGTRIAADGDRVVVTVTDTGIGIPADDVPGLFTPFHRAANAMHLAVQGNGLGLAIVRNIVTEHGGSVAASSELDRGSTFTVMLPAERHPGR